jgi:aryl-alcohol dehydrogenase-like predicted oxidoreductase
MSHEINDRGLSAYHIRQACEDSLRRLQTDHIDIYYMHHIDRGEHPPSIYSDWLGLPDRDLFRPPHLKRETPWEEIWLAMEVLVQQGKVLYVASSNFAGWHIAQASARFVSRVPITCVTAWLS